MASDIVEGAPDTPSLSQTSAANSDPATAPQRDLHHREATRHEQRELFKVLRRDIVEFNTKTNEYELKYYGSDSPNSERRLRLSELKTDHSLDDDKFKYGLVRFYCYMVLIICTLPLLNEFAALGERDLGVPASPTILIVTLVAGMALYFALVRLSLITNFVGVDAMWTNAIDQIFSLDVRVRMDGVRDCMLKFRQFIKWRRFANFFLGIFNFVAPIVIVIAAATAWWSGVLELNEGATMAGFSIGLVASILWFIRQREEHTDWRDPTVQICVAMAEMHRRYVESKILNEGRGSAGN